MTLRMLTTAFTLALTCGAAAADEPKRERFELRLAETKAGDGLTEAKVEGSTDKVYLHKAAFLGSKDVEAVEVIPEDGKDTFTIEVRFTEAGGDKMRAATEKHTDRPLAVVVDGKVIVAPVVRARIGSRAALTGKFSKEQAEKYATAIRSK